MIKPIAITLGEPTGIGPDIVLELIQKKLNYPYLIIGSLDLLKSRATLLNKTTQKKFKINPDNIYNMDLFNHKKKYNYSLACLKIATQLCLDKKCSALITGPVNKALINQQTGASFTGHTQYLAKLTQTNDPVMFFMSPHLKLALVTDHVPLSQVSRLITQKRLKAVINEMLKLGYAKIAVCGLNPHAGEGGYLGREEINVIKPVIKTYQNKNNKIIISGPYSADSLFHEKNVKKYDVIIAMYHDQGLSVLKHRDFGKAMNITLGLPFLRTSVDHGTAIELAGTGRADASNMKYVFAETVKLLC